MSKKVSSKKVKKITKPAEHDEHEHDEHEKKGETIEEIVTRLRNTHIKASDELKKLVEQLNELKDKIIQKQQEVYTAHIELTNTQINFLGGSLQRLQSQKEEKSSEEQRAPEEDADE